MHKYCQVCGNPIFTNEARGTEANGEYSRDFCANCYHGGHFSGDFTGNYHYAENPAAFAAPYYPGMYGYIGDMF